jgi:plastocyanin
MKRRQVLASLAAAGTATFAGCSGGGGDGGDTDATATEATTETATKAPPPTTDPGTDTEPTTGPDTATEETTASGDDTPTATATPTETATSTPTKTESAGTTVEIEGFAYKPTRAKVEPGTTVTWTNEGGGPHDVTATKFVDDAESWDFAKRLPGGGSVQYTFEEPGIYQYYCRIHGKRAVCGAILVGDVSLSSSMPCE